MYKCPRYVEKERKSVAEGRRMTGWADATHTVCDVWKTSLNQLRVRIFAVQEARLA